MRRSIRRFARGVAALFAVALAPAAHAETALPDPLAAGWKGVPVCELLHEDAHQRALRCTFPPGVGHERHFHAPHFGYVISGSTLRVTDANGTRDQVLVSGSSSASPGVEWHEGVNVGDTTLVYLIVEPKLP